MNVSAEYAKYIHIRKRNVTYYSRKHPELSFKVCSVHMMLHTHGTEHQTTLTVLTQELATCAGSLW